MYGMVVCIHTNKISFLQYYNFTWSPHTIYLVVCHVAQENGARVNGVSIMTGTTKSQFHASVAP